MITISLCMIVKNEEKVLARCLDSIADLMDEIIIVDTGSSDNTKEIAKKYTDKIYDFAWIDDFSAARNYSFSKATKEYIYVADADEVIDADNHRKLAELKEVLIPEIEIVQMRYCNQLTNGTAYNFDEEYRPKLYKRCMKWFVWIRLFMTVKLIFCICRKACTAAEILLCFKSRFKKDSGFPRDCIICMQWNCIFPEVMKM